MVPWLLVMEKKNAFLTGSPFPVTARSSSWPRMPPTTAATAGISYLTQR